MFMIETKKRKSENPNTLVRMPLAKDVGFLIQQSEICQKKKKKSVECSTGFKSFIHLYCHYLLTYWLLWIKLLSWLFLRCLK